MHRIDYRPIGMPLLDIFCHCNFFKIFVEKSLIIFCYDALIKVCLLKIDHFPKIVDHNDGAPTVAAF